MQHIGTIKFTTHEVSVNYNDHSDTLHCFKHNGHATDWEVFTKQDHDSMCEWIITALPDGRWQYVEDSTS
jgi:hypothetical protein